MKMKKVNGRAKPTINKKPGQLIYVDTMYWDIPSYDGFRYVIVALTQSPNELQLYLPKINLRSSIY
jgi:hypothetical protein